MHLVKETHGRLKLDVATNNIAHYGQPQQSCRYFQLSVEGIVPQPIPPNNLQQTIVQQNGPRQQDNHRQLQQ